MTSPDGVTWTARTAPAATVGAGGGVAYGNGLFVAHVARPLMTSPDGITWTLQTAAEANSWRSVIYGNGKFVAVATTGTHRAMTLPQCH